MAYHLATGQPPTTISKIDEFASIMQFMKRRIGLLFLSVFAAFGVLISLFTNARGAYLTQNNPPTEKIEPALLEAMVDGTAVRFIVEMADTAVLPTTLAETTAQQAAMLDTLQQTAANSQAAALATLNNLATVGDVANVRSLWIVNSIAATGNFTAVQTIASLPEVAQVRLDVVVQQIGATDTPTATLLATSAAVVTGPVASWGIEKINAPSVWHGLGIDGSGVTVAIMDTGVDWQHPDLMDNYRGNQGGTVDHAGNWFNAVVPTDTVPVDNFGHGTHVAGTAVGHNGIGVAPGANWIAVNVAGPLGFIWESDVHRGFEWLLAPNGDVSLAPDVVNNSWGSTIPNNLFINDIAALHAANINVVFSAGNSGPFTSTVGYPAGYPGVLSIGASDEIDEVAWFSSRGPSYLTNELKPWIVAPGTQILSALPGGVYGLQNGTSMASPHVAGSIALLLAANPSLTRLEINQILADTAVPLGNTPNNNSGWGRLDVYAAVATQASAGVLTGQLLGNSVPLPNAVVTITTSSGAELLFMTDGNGRYRANLQSGSYIIRSQPFGYTQTAISNVLVTAGQTTTRNLTVNLLPSGQIEGTVRAAAGYLPLANAQIEVVGTPITLLTDANGRYALTLPVGSYELIVRKTGQRVQRAEVWLGAGTAVVQNFFLPDAPTVLLVDSGQWYFNSQTPFYHEALNSLNYSYDTWTIRNPIELPTLDTLSEYEAVIWSSPLDSPGYLELNNVITDYLGLGGHLFISGQNVGLYDGGLDTQYWWYRNLNATYLGKTAVTQTITGSPTSPFSGLSFSLNGGSSSNNQTFVDAAQPRTEVLSDAAFVYEDGTAAGLTAGYCTPFRLVHLGFGLEGVSEAADRAAILADSFAYFNTPREQVGSQFLPTAIDELAIPGTQMAYTIKLFNRSETLTDTFTLAIFGADWPTNLLTKTLTIGPCQAGETVLTLDVPLNLPGGEVEQVWVTAVSHNSPGKISDIIVQHTAPGNILFVDDDRWYDQSAELKASLDSLGLTYDVWDTKHATISRNGPPLALLIQYDFVIWYTGYDWFQPITLAENLNLQAYLAQGGRLFLTSQDFLYYHLRTSLAKRYFGVESYQESIGPNRLIGFGQSATNLPPLWLDFDPYQNHGDGIVPAAHSQPFFWSDRALPAGTATAGDHWRAILWAVPFETISPTQQFQAMDRVMGWLSDLGDSTFAVDQRIGEIGQARTYTLTLHQAAGGVSNSAWMTNTLSPWLKLDLASVTGGAVYDATAHQLTWRGTLPSGGSHTITYQATPSGPLSLGQIIENEVQLHDGRHDLIFSRQAHSWVQAPDIATMVTAVPNQPLAATIFTYTVGLQNGGLAASGNISTVVSLPNTFYIVTDTLTSSAGSAAVGDRQLTWAGTLNVAEQVTMTLVLTRESTAVPQRIAITTLVDDGITQPTFFYQWADLPAFRYFFPVIGKP